ncbi:MAG: LysR family transcriptional regulator [Pseudomonadota bacterium]
MMMVPPNALHGTRRKLGGRTRWENCDILLGCYTQMMEWSRLSFDWNHARAFLATAQEGSFSAAARKLGQTQPTISRQVTALEDALGVTLFERSSRVFALTQTGAELAQHFTAMGEAAQRISLAAAGQSESFNGTVVIAATNLMATHFLPPMFKTIQQLAPKLKIQVLTSNEVTDLTRREADIAIRHSRPTQDTLFGKRMRDTAAFLYASSAYLKAHGRPESLADVAKMTMVGVEDPRFLHPLLTARGIDMPLDNINFMTASATLSLSLIREGVGIGFMPAQVADICPELELVWPQLEPIPIEIWLVTHRELRTNPQIRLVFDVLSAGLSANVVPLAAPPS